ncbi:MAG: hypothetical protein ABEJ56_00015 [Candidatus Nanohaloarchaea archaeon]
MNRTGFASRILEKLGVSPVEVLKHRYDIKDDKALVKEIAEILEVDLDPVKFVHEINDSPETCVFVQVDMTDRQTVEFANKVKSEFVKKYGHDPQSLIFVRNDLQGIDKMDPSEVRERVKPWLD